MRFVIPTHPTAPASPSSLAARLPTPPAPLHPSPSSLPPARLPIRPLPLPRRNSAEDVLGGEGEALRWFPYPWEGGSSSSRNTHDTDAARPASSSAPPAEIAPAAASSSVAGVNPAPPPVGKASSSPSSPSSGRCIIRPAVYGPGGERADVAIPLGGRVEEAGTGLAEEAVALSSNGAITSYIAATAAAAAAGSCGGGGGSGGAENAAAAAGSGESVAAGERGDAHGEEGLPKSVIAVVETTSPDLARSEAPESGNGIGLPGVQGTSGLAEDAGGAKKKLSRKVSCCSDNALVRRVAEEASCRRWYFDGLA